MAYQRVCYILSGLVFAASIALFSIPSWMNVDAMFYSDVDLDLAKAIEVFNLRPLQVRRFEADPKFSLGQALFFDPILSGPRDVSCATCHLLRYGTSDGLARSIGIHGLGLGPARRLTKGKHTHPRNALDLWNRDHNAVRALFWDGRVEALDPQRRIFRSPLGRELPSGLDNALAVQALFPLVTVDEMLGESSDRSSPDLPNGHGGLPNDLVRRDQPTSEGSRIKASHALLMARLLGTDSANEWQGQYRLLFRKAYPGKNTFTIVDVANAIAHFEEMAFATRDSAWDRYLRGETKTLPADAKRGALVFYGKGRCAVCHSGPLFSDFNYHSIGVFGDESGGSVIEDFGRWNATHREEDRYKFRTPPLRNVTQTSPYFHDGSEGRLRGAVAQHLDPLEKADKYKRDGSFAMSIKQINAISPILSRRLQLSEKEVNYLLAFLSALNYQPMNVDALVPKSVPSGLVVEYK